MVVKMIIEKFTLLEILIYTKLRNLMLLFTQKNQITLKEMVLYDQRIVIVIIVTKHFEQKLEDLQQIILQTQLDYFPHLLLTQNYILYLQVLKPEKMLLLLVSNQVLLMILTQIQLLLLNLIVKSELLP